MKNPERIARALLATLAGCCWIAAKEPAFAEWPTYRGDARRSGYTAEALPAKLSLQWTYQLRHAPQPAWTGRDTRMPFDRASHTVIAGATLFFGSSADGKVYALETATGTPRWTFFTAGPVRFAPAVWKDRVLVVSDDGFLYCLSAAEGKLLWKLRGGPSLRGEGESMILGNGRMISRWPARGGPVIADGVVYFAAGIWPSEGIFVSAVEIATGKVRWCNDTAGGLTMPQPHGGANAKSGISAQGYLVLTGDRLLIPTGRAVPAALDPAEGTFLYFQLQQHGKGKGGGSEVVAADSLFLNGDCFFGTQNGDMFGKGISTSAVAITPEGIIHARDDAIFRSRLISQEIADRKGNKLPRKVPGKPDLVMKTPPKTTHSLIVADQAIIAGGESSISVFDGKSNRLALTAEVDGVPYGLAAADGKLFVSTDKGMIYCFGNHTVEPPKMHAADTAADVYANRNTFDAAAEEILRLSGVGEGYCLDLACGEGALAYALAKRSKLQIYAIDSDPTKVARARRQLDAAGLYGVRVTVHQGDPAAAAYPSCFADLVVSGRSVTEGPGVVPAEEVSRLQRPYGGVACIGQPGTMRHSVRGPLDGAGSWTHQYCDPANTNCSSDALVQGPLGMLWFADLNFQMPSRHGRGPAPMFLGGRVFVEGLHALRCVDAYNGRTLWEFPLPGILTAYDQEHLMGTAGTGSNCCVTGEAVYVRLGGKCLRIDPAGGKLLDEFPAPKQPDGTEGTWGYIACAGGTLFGTLADTEHRVKYRYGRSDMSTQFTESRLLFALDGKTGKLKFSYTAEQSIRHNAIAVAAGRVYLIDREPAAMDDPRKGDTAAKHKPGVLIALDAETGQELWKQGEQIYGTILAASEAHDVLLMAYQDTRFKLDSELGGRMAAFRASDGRRLWDIQARYGSRPIINDRTIYAPPGAWDLLSGQPKQFPFRRSYGCGILAGSKNLLVYRSATLGYTDLSDNSGTENYGGIRPGCWINAIPAGGLVLMPDATDRCTCSYLIKASIALKPMTRR